MHPAREKSQFNPQLSQLLWIIQYNFYSFHQPKSPPQPSSFSTGIWSFIRLRKLRVEALILAGKMNKNYIRYSAGYHFG